MSKGQSSCPRLSHYGGTESARRSSAETVPSMRLGIESAAIVTGGSWDGFFSDGN